MLKIDYNVFSREYFPLLPGKRYITALRVTKYLYIVTISTYARISIHSSRLFFFSYDETTLDWQAKRNRTFCGKHELNSST